MGWFRLRKSLRMRVKIGQTETAAPGRWSGVRAAGLRPKAHDCGGMNLL
jgi:hypothetical protein